MATTQQSAESTAANSNPAASNSTNPSTIPQDEKNSNTPNPARLDLELEELFSENVVAKMWNVAIRLLADQNNKPTHYPETVPQTGPNTGTYALRDAAFWTCGFFPGSLYLLLERSIKYPQYLAIPSQGRLQFSAELTKIARAWAEPLRAMARRTDTHDLGFMIQPSFRMDWELTNNRESLDVVVTAAESLMARYDGRVKAVRSWDRQVTKRYEFTDKEAEFLVIVDSMCNLDLLFYAGHHTGNREMIDVATTHARTVLKEVVREDFSTYHLVVFDTKSGAVKEKLTCQGYKDKSTWSRGQAWAILGFTQTYIWTKDPTFLHASIALANYFLSRLDTSPYPSPYVPLWDFDAPVPLPGQEAPLRDTSAGMIAANGILLLSQVLRGIDGERFRNAAVRVVKETIELSLDGSKETLRFKGSEVMEGRVGFDAILRNATANANQDALRRYWDHGLVYADYFFLEFGNRLLRMGLL
ncbi:glycoside hydrolase family 88 protein [Stipitochalara longipes BDJ]|nr:glycoside hydrolase family 88 protein [Stipitochalara longipes BDJ]